MADRSDDFVIWKIHSPYQRTVINIIPYSSHDLISPQPLRADSIIQREVKLRKKLVKYFPSFRRGGIQTSLLILVHNNKELRAAHRIDNGELDDPAHINVKFG